MADSELPKPLVTTQWLSDNLGAADLRIVDCTVVMHPTADGGYTFGDGAEAWRQGHIPGSVYVDVLGELAAKDHALPMMMPSPEAFAQTMSRLGISDDSRVVLYDRSNHAWAARLWWMLRYCGFDRAAVLDGGWIRWLAQGRPTSVEVSEVAPGRFTVNVDEARFARKQDVIDAIKTTDTCLINALSPEEHKGESSRWPRAGRIAGSHNVYCQSLIDPETGVYLPKDELRKRFEASGALASGKAITYCGAGIAASSDALVLTLLGHDNVAVYDGSLAEWTSDPDTPMETG